MDDDEEMFFGGDSESHNSSFQLRVTEDTPSPRSRRLDPGTLQRPAILVWSLVMMMTILKYIISTLHPSLNEGWLALFACGRRSHYPQSRT